MRYFRTNRLKPNGKHMHQLWCDITSEGINHFTIIQTLHKALVWFIMTFVCPAWVWGADKCLSKSHRLQNNAFVRNKLHSGPIFVHRRVFSSIRICHQSYKFRHSHCAIIREIQESWLTLITSKIVRCNRGHTASQATRDQSS